MFQSLIGTIKTKIIRDTFMIEKKVSIPYRDDKNFLLLFLLFSIDDQFQSLIGTIKTETYDCNKKEGI